MTHGVSSYARPRLEEECNERMGGMDRKAVHGEDVKILRALDYLRTNLGRRVL
jgi:hypothetical protein